jgi:hypothetical protein
MYGEKTLGGNTLQRRFANRPSVNYFVDQFTLERMTRDRYVSGQWKLLVKVLEDLRSTRMGITEGCRNVVALRHALGQEANELFLPFVAVDSETDHFPLGDVRTSWSSSALEREDKERLACEQFHFGAIADAAGKLLPYARQHAL